MNLSTEAYLNPGTGSLILQGAVLAVGTGFLLIRIYWKRIQVYYQKNFKKNKTDSNSEKKIEE